MRLHLYTFVNYSIHNINGDAHQAPLKKEIYIEKITNRYAKSYYSS